MTRRERLAAWAALAITSTLIAAWAALATAKRITHWKVTT